jgi:hypothetical protein
LSIVIKSAGAGSGALTVNAFWRVNVVDEPSASAASGPARRTEPASWASSRRLTAICDRATAALRWRGCTAVPEKARAARATECIMVRVSLDGVPWKELERAGKNSRLPTI